MPTPYENLAPYLRANGIVEIGDQSSLSTRYSYRGPADVLTANKPTIGTTWADGYRVARRVYTLITAAVGNYADLDVETAVFNEHLSSVLGTPIEEDSYESITWRPVNIAIELHPTFNSGGGAFTATDRRCVIGWKAEMDPSLKAAYKFRQLDSNGTPGAEVDITTTAPNVIPLLRLLLMGVEEFLTYMPVYRLRTIYEGSVPPTVGTCGQKDEPSGDAVPGGYEWVKSADNVERVGHSTKWRRDEEWEGAKTWYVDADAIFLP